MVFLKLFFLEICFWCDFIGKMMCFEMVFYGFLETFFFLEIRFWCDYIGKIVCFEMVFEGFFSTFFF